jgi:hypothetical protein
MTFTTIARIGLTLLLNTFIAFAQLDDGSREEDICSLYLAPSTIPNAGRGVFAGKYYESQYSLLSTPSLTVPNEHLFYTQLGNYVYASEEEGHSLVVFGVAMLFNHKPQGESTMYHSWADSEVAKVADQLEAHSTFTEIVYTFQTETQPGEEMFASYGDDDSWFGSRGIGSDSNESNESDSTAPIDEKKTYSLDELKRVGQCLSDVYVGQSLLPMAGKGLFAKRSFKAGEVVSISPVLVLDLDRVVDSFLESVLVNYCVTKQGAKVALLPITLMAMANHAIKEYANMKIEWFDWGDVDDSISSRLDLPIEAILEMKFAPLDIKYVATKDIHVGDELTIDYGNIWMHTWYNFLGERLQWLEEAGINVDVDVRETVADTMPIFRQPVEAPDGLFPMHWFYEDDESQAHAKRQAQAAGQMCEAAI